MLWHRTAEAEMASEAGPDSGSQAPRRVKAATADDSSRSGREGCEAPGGVNPVIRRTWRLAAACAGGRLEMARRLTGERHSGIAGGAAQRPVPVRAVQRRRRGVAGLRMWFVQQSEADGFLSCEGVAVDSDSVSCGCLKTKTFSKL